MGEVLYKLNSLCATFSGPGVTNFTTLDCSEPKKGRYLTLQRVKENLIHPDLAVFELLIETRPAPPEETIEILLRAANDGEAPAGQCPEHLPFAFAGGSECCETSLSNHPSEGLTGWETKGRQGHLHYDSSTCYGTNGSCLIPPCINYNFQKYSCFMEDVDLVGDDISADVPKETLEECAKFARTFPEAEGFI